LLHQAADCDTGELGAGLEAEWLNPHRDATTRHLIDTYTHLADTEPDHRAALALLRQAIRIAPHNEPLHQAIMRRQNAAGDAAGVQRTLSTLTQRLAELHTEPSSDTRRLAATLSLQTHQPTRSDTTDR
jgi:DNA-binding SARP family transcriptional activator